MVSQNRKHPLDSADACWRRPRVWAFCASMARDSRSRSGFSTRIAIASGTLAVACSAVSIARIDPSLVDSELDRFFLATPAAYCNRISIGITRSRSTYRRGPLAWAYARQSNQVVADPPLARARVLHEPNCWPFPLELSLAAFFPFGARNLRW